MSHFVFTGSQGRFPIPDGESRVGSDTSCPICIQGDGVHPVHAYLKADGEKLMIRPSSEKSPVLVENQPISGPQAILDGQAVSIGPVHLRLESDGKRPQPLLKKRWFRTFLYVAGGVAALVLLAVLLRLLWFNDGWFKARIVAQVDAALKRDDTEIESVHVGLMDGEISIVNLRVPNKEPLEAKDLIHVDEIRGRLDPWALLKSWFTGALELRASSLQVVRPRLFIERYERDGHAVSNIDDIVARYLEGPPQAFPIDLGLAALETHITVEDGQVLLDDRYTRLGKTSFERIDADLRQDALGQNLNFEASAGMRTPDRECGEIGLKKVQFLLIDKEGKIVPKEIGDGSATLKLNKFDLARLFSHLDWSFPVNRGEQRVVVGKPVTGEFKVSFQDVKNFLLTGSAESESLVSVLEKDQAPVGNIPTRLDVDLNYNLDKGPMEISLVLRSATTLAAVRDPGQPQILVLRADGKRDPAGDYRYDVKLKAILQDLFATDVGDRLKLKGRLRGVLEGDAAITYAKGEMKIDGSLAQKGEAFVPHPTDPQGKGEWIPTNVKAECNATALPNDHGEISHLEARFKAKADSKSFEAESLTPARIESLDNLEKLKVNTQFKLNLLGREFWQEFGTYMKLLGFSEPVEERLDLKVTVYSGPDEDPKAQQQQKIRVGLRGKAQAQWNPELPPVELLAHLEYFPDLVLPKSVAPPPFLKLTLQTGDEQTPPFVRLEGAELTRVGSHETLTVPMLKIESDLEALRERFDPYFKRIAKFLGTNVYDAYRITGSPHAQCKLSLAWDAEPTPEGTRAIESAFDLSVEGENLAIAGPVPAQLTAKEGEPVRRWEWSELKPVFSVKGGYRKRPAASKEEPDFHRLDLDELDMKGSLGAFKLRAKNVDLWLLEKLADKKARLPGKVLPDAVSDFSFAGTVESAAFELLRRLEFLPAEPAIAGELKLQADYKRDTGRLTLKELVFRNDEKDGFWLKDLDALAALQGVRDVFLASNQTAGGSGIAAALLEHLNEFLVVKSMTLDAEGLSRWVLANPTLAQERHVPEALVGLITSKRLQPSGTWTIKDLALRPAPGRDRTWSLVGQFHNDLRYILPCLAGERPREFTLKGPWSIRENDASAVSFTEDYRNVSLVLNATFEKSDVNLFCSLPELGAQARFEDYAKPAGQPLTVGLQASYSPGGANRDAIYYVDNAELKGGPRRADISGVEVRTNVDAKSGAETVKTLSIQQAHLAGGPLNRPAQEPWGLEKLNYDSETNVVRGQLKIPSLSATELLYVLAKPSDKSVMDWYFNPNNLARFAPAFAGLLDSKDPGANGSVAAISLEFQGDRRRLDLLDPLPAQDKFDLKGQFQNLRLARASLAAQLNGPWSMSNSELSSVGMEVALNCTLPAMGERPAKPVLLAASLDGLWIASRDERRNLQQALAEKVMPLQLKLPFHFKTPLDAEQLGALADALRRISGGSGVQAREGNPYDGLAGLNIDGSLSAPSLSWGAGAIDQPLAPKFTLKDLKLAVPLATGQFAGGSLAISAFNGDLSTATAEFPLHLKYSCNVKLIKADLPKLLFGLQPPPAEGHRTEGSVSIEGVLSGNGFETAARRTWQGGVETSLLNLALEFAPGPVKDPRWDRRPDWAKSLSPGAACALALQGSRRAVSAADLVANSAALNNLKDRTVALTKAALFGMELYLSRFGAEAKRIEFEPARLLVTVTNGIADIKLAPQGKLAAKAQLAGLEFGLQGRVRLWDLSIDEPLLLSLTRLPEACLDKLAPAFWPQEKREEFLKDLGDGGLALRITGTLDNPQIEFPMEKLNRYAMEAVFGLEKFKDAQALEAGLQFFRTSKWNQSDAALAAAANLLDRMGVGLPGTETHKLQGWCVLDRATGLPPHIRDMLSPLAETLTPEQSLRKLLEPPPPPNPKAPKEGPPGNSGKPDAK
ncbi:MAG: hypothetical protein HY291_11350 [Planctomycetes bacterium]|nr:hypothetical protein [Planctomycetota bacterium]